MSGYLRKMARKQMRTNKGLMNRTVRHHEDVLKDIESTLVRAYRQIEDVDDAICHASIESALMGQAPKHPLAALLAGNMAAARKLRSEVPDNAWQDALRVVAGSIRNHSSRQPGEIGYLAFVNVFIG